MLNNMYLICVSGIISGEKNKTTQHDNENTLKRLRPGRPRRSIKAQLTYK